MLSKYIYSVSFRYCVTAKCIDEHRGQFFCEFVNLDDESMDYQCELKL